MNFIRVEAQNLQLIIQQLTEGVNIIWAIYWPLKPFLVERSACAACGCWHKRRWALFLVFFRILVLLGPSYLLPQRGLSQDFKFLHGLPINPILTGKLAYFKYILKDLSQTSETLNMTSEGLGELLEGNTADTGAGKFLQVSMGAGGQAEGLPCADLEARQSLQL